MSDAAAPTDCTILLADDDAAVLQVLAFAFKKAGYHVTTAEDGTKALAALEGKRYDLLLLDILMPGATGWEVLARAIETTPAGKPLPRAVLITGFNQEYVLDFQLLQEEGVSAMLLKPFTAAVILEEVERVLAMPPVFTLPKAAQKSKA